MPLAAAGLRIEPPVSVPSVAGANPAATAAPEPDDDPAGEWSRFHGLRAGGNSTSQEGPPCANSQVAFLPSSTPPAAERRSCASQSSAGTWSASSLDWAV